MVLNVGLEPTTFGLQDRCSIQLKLIQHIMGGMVGIEPTPAASNSIVVLFAEQSIRLFI